MKLISEMFEEVEKAKTKKEKIEALKRNDCYSLRNILIGTYAPFVQFVFEEIPPYKESDAPIGLGYTTIHKELDRVYLFEKNTNKVSPDLTHDRKKQILIQILEALEKNEAKIFANMLMKKQNVKGLDAALVKEAFPNLF